MTKTIVVIPTYNEADNLSAITAALFSLNLEGLEILCVDDNSPDGTGQIADQLVEQNAGKFHVIHRYDKRGLGSAQIDGFKYALDQGVDFIIQMDADFSHSPQYIPVMLEHIHEYDVVVGSRYTKGGSVDDRWGFGRWFLSWWANSIWVRLILGVNTKDATAGFKCWRASALEKIQLDRIHSNGYVFQVEMCYVAEKIGLRIKEIPIHFEDRRIGMSKMSMKTKIDSALRVFEIRMRHSGLKPAHTETLA
jgi:dolichol-phosphate mannosyltransferase